MQFSSSDRDGLVEALRSIEDMYAYGVPISRIPTEIDSVDQTLDLVRLVAVVSQEEAKNQALLELLRRIVEKGLELEWRFVRLSNSCESTPENAAVIVFGVEEHIPWTQGVPADKVLSTVRLAAINADTTIKRQFWLRLQAFRGVI